MRTIGKAVVAAAMAVALLVAGALAFVRSPGETPQVPARAASASALLVPAVAAGSLDGTIASLQDRLEGPAARLARLRLARTRVRRAGQGHGRPVLVPEGRGRARADRSASTGRQRRGRAGARRPGSGATRLRVRAPTGSSRLGARPVLGRRVRRDRGRAGRAWPIRPTRSSPSRRWWTPGRTSPRTRASPTPASSSATSAARERAMRMAFGAAGTPSDSAWSAYQLGELAFGSGDVGSAREWYRRGLDLDPAYVPNLAGLAKVAWARGDDELAIARYTDVVARYPSAEFVVALADLYRVTGQLDLADRQEAVVAAMHRARDRQRRERGPGARAVRRRPRRSRGRARRRPRRVGAPAERPRRRRLRVGAARERSIRAGGGARGPRPRARDAQRAVPLPRRDDPARARGRGRGPPVPARKRSRRTRTSRSCTPPMPRRVLSDLRTATPETGR